MMHAVVFVQKFFHGHLDRATLEACLRDPRANFLRCKEALYWRTRQLRDIEQLKIVFSQVREQNKTSSNLPDHEIIRDYFEVAAKDDRKDVPKYLITNFRNEVQAFAKDIAFSVVQWDIDHKNVAEIILSLLKERLIKVNERNSERSTLLHYAGIEKNTHLISMLKSLRANLFARDIFGKMAWEVAQPILTLKALEDYVADFAGPPYQRTGRILTRIPGNGSIIGENSWIF